jgi:hypothetical protein
MTSNYNSGKLTIVGLLLALGVGIACWTAFASGSESDRTVATGSKVKRERPSDDGRVTRHPDRRPSAVDNGRKAVKVVGRRDDTARNSTVRRPPRGHQAVKEKKITPSV